MDGGNRTLIRTEADKNRERCFYEFLVHTSACLSVGRAGRKGKHNSVLHHIAVVRRSLENQIWHGSGKGKSPPSRWPAAARSQNPNSPSQSAPAALTRPCSRSVSNEAPKGAISPSTVVTQVKSEGFKEVSPSMKSAQHVMRVELNLGYKLLLGTVSSCVPH